MRRPSAVELQLAKALATLICAYRWRWAEPGASHSAAEPCPACRRLVQEDLHGLLGDLLFRAYLCGHSDAEDAVDVEIDLPAFDAVVAAVAERAVVTCQEHLARVVQSDPRTFEPRSVSGRPAVEGGG